MKMIRLSFVVKGQIQTELINTEHISRVLEVGGDWYIGLLGQDYTKLLTEESAAYLAYFIHEAKND